MTWQHCHLNPEIVQTPADGRPQTPSSSQLQLQIYLGCQRPQCAKNMSMMVLLGRAGTLPCPTGPTVSKSSQVVQMRPHHLPGLGGVCVAPTLTVTVLLLHYCVCLPFCRCQADNQGNCGLVWGFFFLYKSPQASRAFDAIYLFIYLMLFII